MSKWKYRDEGKLISAAVIKDKPSDELRSTRKFLEDLLEFRRSSKLTKTYINGTKKALAYTGTGKVYVDFRMEGTATGRLSCAAYKADEPMGVSFHTLPREKKDNIRSLFVAPPGWKFITADYAAMELRVLSHIAKDTNMQRAFNEKHDLHTYTAQLLFNKTNITKDQRQIAKAVSFLIVYGGGAFNLSETMGIPLRQAERIIENYQNVYPAVFEYMDFVNRYILENQYAYTIFGRKRHLVNVTSRDKKIVARALRQGLNFTIQSPASDIIMCAVLGITRTFKAEGMQARIVATVHDSIEIVCPPEEVEKTLEIVYNQMVDYPIMRTIFNLHLDVPFAIEVEVGDSFGTGEEVFFENGKPLMEAMV